MPEVIEGFWRIRNGFLESPPGDTFHAQDSRINDKVILPGRHHGDDASDRKNPVIMVGQDARKFRMKNMKTHSLSDSCHMVRPQGWKYLRLVFSILFLVGTISRADSYLFLLNRFGGIEIRTSGESGNVRFFQGDKQGEETTFQSKLRVSSPGTFLTPGGVKFAIEKLSKPIIHDGNRRINSGDYRLRITGTGPAYDATKAKLPWLADFAAGGEKMTFYGEKTD